MRRIRAGVVAAMAVGAIAAGALSAAAGPPPEFTDSVLQVRKVVVGTATQDFLVLVTCTPSLRGVGAEFNGFVESTLIFGPDGTPKTADGDPGWQIVGGQWENATGAVEGDQCTVTETGTGGATPVTYACAWVLNESPDGIAGVGCPGDASGPSTSPATVSFEPIGGDVGTVTITNTFTASVQAVEAAAQTVG
jgi:hypothetical protein